MAYRTPDRAQEQVTGTTTLVLNGGPPQNWRTLAAAGVADGDFFPGVVTHRAIAQWQSGVWRRSGTSIVLARFHASSTGIAIATFAAGVKDVAVTPLGRNASLTVVTAADSPFDALPGDDLAADTRDGEVTVQLWDAVEGEPAVKISDYSDSWPTHNLLIRANTGFTFSPTSADVVRCSDSASLAVRYAGSAWRIRVGVV